MVGGLMNVAAHGNGPTIRYQQRSSPAFRSAQARLSHRELDDGWNRFPPYSTVILPTDRDFDLCEHEAQSDSMFVVVDPIFDASANPIGGFLVSDINEMLARAAAKGGSGSVDDDESQYRYRR